MPTAEGGPDRLARGEIISVGSINADVQMRTSRPPRPGETLPAEEFRLLGGGKGANVAIVARRLGLPARLLGRVGDDPLGDLALEPLRDEGVDLSGVRRLQGRATAVSLITVFPDGGKAILLASNANEQWEDGADEEVAKAIDAAPIGSVLAVDLEVSMPIVERAIEAARARDFAVILDPSPASRMAPALYPAIDYITPNPPEAEELTGLTVDSVESAAEAGRRLVERGVGNACVKLEDGGCVLATATGQQHVPAPAVEAVDKTGAGDAFAGALACAVLEGREPLEAVRFAASVAAFAVTRYGSQPAYPTRDQLRRFASGTARTGTS